MVMKISTATLGRKFNTIRDKHQYKYFPSASINRLVHGFDPIGRHIEQVDHSGYKDILPSSMEHIRKSFAVQCEHGVLKKPKIHVTFEYPHSAEQCCGCKGKDFLYLIIGLVNILVLQFVMVILLFFAEHENKDNIYNKMAS